MRCAQLTQPVGRGLPLSIATISGEDLTEDLQEQVMHLRTPLHIQMYFKIRILAWPGRMSLLLLPLQVRALHRKCFPEEHIPGEEESLKDFMERITFLHDLKDCCWFLLWEDTGTKG